MRLYHLNCGTMLPLFPRVRGIIYCLLVETNDGLLLVDTGIGTRDYTDPNWLVYLFTRGLRMHCDLEETAAHQIVRLGYQVSDVKHIVMTHLHLDHAGGLADFPEAKVHVLRSEYETAMARRGIMGKCYVADHWSHGPNWMIHEGEPETWFAFDGYRVQEGLHPEVLMIPLPGHTPGHCGVAIKIPGAWWLHCGDAVSRFYPSADPYCLSDGRPNWLVRQMVGENIPQLRELIREHGDEVKIIGSHDSRSLARYQRIRRQGARIG